MLDCEKFNPGEALVKQYLQDIGRTVIDVSKNSDYWVQDIDFIAIKGQLTEKIEVKYDRNMNRYQSMFVELKSNIEKGLPGWIDTTKADFIFYVDAVSLDCYIVRPQDLRDYISTHDYQIRYCSKDGYKTSSGAIVPLKEFSSHYRLTRKNLKKYQI